MVHLVILLFFYNLGFGFILILIFWGITLLFLFRDGDSNSKENDWLNNFVNSFIKGIKNRPYSFISLFIGVFLFSLVFNVTFCSICISYYPHTISTSFSRKILEIGKVCNYNDICFSYLTVANDVRTQMIVNFQFAGPQPNQANVTYWELNSNMNISIIANCFDVNNPDEERYQCWADLTQLTPNTTYFFYCTVESNTLINTQVQKFRTGAQDSVLFVSGGDLSWGPAVITLFNYTIKFEPIFAIIGGDIAYENGDKNCYMVYDQWFKNWNTYMITPSGYSIPILTAQGNHEAGGFKKPRDTDFFSLKYFPHETNISTVAPQDRSVYHSHRLTSNSLLIILDSWVHETPQSQVPFINSTLNTNDKFKFAAYHVSMYPFIDISSETQNLEISTLLNTYWRPLFDQYGVTAAFENHCKFFFVYTFSSWL